MRNSHRLSDGDDAQRRTRDRRVCNLCVSNVRRVFQDRLTDSMSKPGGACDVMLATAWQRMVRTAPVPRALAPAVYAAVAFAIVICGTRSACCSFST